MSQLDLLKKCQELGLDLEGVIEVVKFTETFDDGFELMEAVADGLISGKRHHEAPEFFHDFITRWYKDIAPYYRRGAKRMLKRTSESPPPRSDVYYPCGPKERWGYDGPITPRLSERDWWPLRNSIIEAADWTCHYCQEQHDNMCADHVIPLSRGGTNDPDNLVCACVPCNSSKADRLLSEWKGRYR